MAGILHKTRRAFESPDEICKFFQIRSADLGKLIKSGRFLRAFGMITGGIFGLNIYLYALNWYRGNIVKTVVGNHEMYVDITDEGISRDLLYFGVREEISTEELKEQLNQLSTRCSHITVLEIGANIGYYALIQAELISDGKIIAVEPSPENIQLLARNVKENGYGDIVEITRAAISNETESKILNLSSTSNTHYIGSSENSGSNTTPESIEVQAYSVEDFLKIKDISPTEVQVIRMDVEGHEKYIFENLGFLKGDRPLLVFVEVHFNELETATSKAIISQLSEADLKLVSAVASGRDTGKGTWTGDKLDVHNLDELKFLELNTPVELIAKRGF